MPFDVCAANSRRRAANKSSAVVGQIRYCISRKHQFENQIINGRETYMDPTMPLMWQTVTQKAVQV